MNDIEKLIAGLPRPFPPTNLDARILAVTRQPARGRALRGRLELLSLLVACTAGAMLIGFILGRQSAIPTVGNHAVPVATITYELNTPIVDSTPEHVSVNVQMLPNEALARFVMPAKRFEGLFGRGPLEDRSGSTSLE